MLLPSATMDTLAQQYPHSAQTLRAFAPLLDDCQRLAEELPPPALGTMDPLQYAQGKPFCVADKENVTWYLDKALLEAAPRLCHAAASGFASLAEGLTALGDFWERDSKACAHLGTLFLTEKSHRASAWAKKHGQHKEAAALMGSHLAHCAALRVARAATLPEGWNKNICPVCGRLPQMGSLRHKEGYRFLHCGLCGHFWRYSRTTCPLCQDTNPDKRQIFTLEGSTPQNRAEGCDVCARYLLVPDMREMAEEIPMSLLAFCLIPMDMLMQQQGYSL